MLGDMDAFQWSLYYGDRPAYETVAAAILQGLFARFPNVQAPALRAGHGVGALLRPQDGPRLPDGPQGDVGQARDAARASTSAAT